jgi:hypothetical protein
MGGGSGKMGSRMGGRGIGGCRGRGENAEDWW